MRRLIFAFVFALFLVSPLQAQDDLPPYIFYFSDILNAIVVERADGTDSRMIGQGLMPPGIANISGPGWSPSGEWFAWKSNYRSYYGEDTTASAYAMRVDDKAYFSGLERDLQRVWYMEWAPTTDQNILLISGDLFRQETAPYPIRFTYWLIDVDHNHILATYNPTITWWDGTRPISTQWSDDGRYVTVYLDESVFDPPAVYFRVTLYLDGTVLKEPVAEPVQGEPEDNYKKGFVDPVTGLPLYGGVIGSPRISVSPSERYRIESIGLESTLIDTFTGRKYELPVHSQTTRGEQVFSWHPSEKWIFKGDSVLVAGGSGPYRRIGVTNSTGTLWRQLGGCYFNPTCIGWLPERVDLHKLPPGSPESVLLAPISMYIVDTYYETYYKPVPNATLSCATGNQWTVVPDNQTTGYSLQYDQECPNDDEANQPVTIVVHPDYPLLFMNQRWSLTITVWDIRSGRLVTTLNSGGSQMFISKTDHSRLYAYDIRGVVVWDVNEITKRYGVQN